MKPCNPKSEKANNPLYECNPKTGRWVLRKGKSFKKAVSPLKPSPARSLLTPIPIVERIVSPKRSPPKRSSPKCSPPKRSSPKRSPPKKVVGNRVKKDRNDVIVVNIGDAQYEYNRADLVYDLEQGPVYFASYNAMVDIADFISKIAAVDPGVGGADYKEAEESIHLLAEKKGSAYLGAFYYALNGFDDENFHYVYNMFNRLMSVYRLYELPDEKDVYLTVNSLDLLRDTQYKEYELIKVGRTKKLTKLGKKEKRELDVYDLLPIGYNGEIPHLVDTKRNKKAYFGTKEITENLHELLKGFWYETRGRRQDKILNIIEKYEFY